MRKLCMLLAVVILLLSVVANDEATMFSTADVVILLGIAVFAITLLIIWCLCESASRGDDIMRREE